MVTRYNPESGQSGEPTMCENSLGDYVEYWDFVAAMADMQDTINDLQHDYDKLVNKIRDLYMEC